MTATETAGYIDIDSFGVVDSKQFEWPAGVVVECLAEAVTSGRVGVGPGGVIGDLALREYESLVEEYSRYPMKNLPGFVAELPFRLDANEWEHFGTLAIVVA